MHRTINFNATYVGIRKYTLDSTKRDLFVYLHIGGAAFSLNYQENRGTMIVIPLIWQQNLVLTGF